ncbi:MAG: nitroreductase family protein [Saprospiraceae bacterium]|nr:nitroreductase family protein [Saprospiraceae bacterium]
MSKENLTFIPFRRSRIEPNDVLKLSKQFRMTMDQRRSLRQFSSEPVPREVVENLIMTASSAPSGAHKQPWTFCIVSDPQLKKQIREAAETEEKINYSGRMSDTWIEDLEPFGTDWQKPFLERAPWLIVVFKKSYDPLPDGGKRKNYYVSESVGLATGFLLTAVHHAGLVALTHTPSPMNFLEKILSRPENEKAFLLIPIGYPAEDAVVPDLKRKELSDIAVFF